MTTLCFGWTPMNTGGREKHIKGSICPRGANYATPTASPRYARPAPTRRYARCAVCMWTESSTSVRRKARLHGRACPRGHPPADTGVCRRSIVNRFMPNIAYSIANAHACRSRRSRIIAATHSAKNTRTSRVFFCLSVLARTVRATLYFCPPFLPSTT